MTQAEVKVDQVVSFVFTSAGRGSYRQRNYAEGIVVKVGKKLSIRVLDKPDAHEFWRNTHVGKIKVVSKSAVIPDLQGAPLVPTVGL